MNTEHRTAMLQNVEHILPLIGITGGIGSGKSYIAQALRTAGYPVYDCDQEAKRIINHNPAVRSQIEYLFGSEVYTNDTYNSQAVAAQVFQQPELLQKLNAIVHPAVRFDILEWAKKQDTPYAFVESAILFESGFDALCQAIIAITAPEEVRIQRAIERDHSTREQILRRIRNQMPEAERNARASLVLYNDGATPIAQMLVSIETFIQQL